MFSNGLGCEETRQSVKSCLRIDFECKLVTQQVVVAFGVNAAVELWCCELAANCDQDLMEFYMYCYASTGKSKKILYCTLMHLFY